MAGELAGTADRERRRLASVLHDGLQQLLVGAQLQMGKVITESGRGPSPTSRRVAQLLDQSIEMSRSLAMEISPPFRFGSGLVAAFTWLARSMGRNTPWKSGCGRRERSIRRERRYPSFSSARSRSFF